MGNTLTKREKKEVFIKMMIVFPFFKIDYLIHLSSVINTLYTVVAMLISIGALSNYVFRYSSTSFRVNKFFLLLILFNLTVLPISVTYGVENWYDIFEFYGSILYRVAFCGVLGAGIKKNSKVMVRAVSNVITIIVIVNIATVFLFPGGLYTTGSGYSLTKYWFLGFDNAHIVMYLFCIMMIGLDNYICSGKVINSKLVAVYLLCLAVTIYVWSATALVALFLLGGYVFFPTIFDKMKSLLNIRTYVVTMSILCIFIIAIAIHSRPGSGALSFLLSDILKKDTGFNSRYFIWSYYLDAIKQHFLFGNGNDTAAMMIEKTGTNGAHNEWLQILYYGGLVHLLIYLSLLYQTVKKLWAYKKTGCAQIVSVSIFCMMVIQLMRGCPEIYWLGMYTVGYYIGYISKQRAIGYHNNMLYSLDMYKPGFARR